MRRTIIDKLKPAVFAIVTALASAFGPMSEESIMFDAAIGEEDAGMQQKVVENFLANSRQFLGL